MVDFQKNKSKIDNFSYQGFQEIVHQSNSEMDQWLAVDDETYAEDSMVKAAFRR